MQIARVRLNNILLRVRKNQLVLLFLLIDQCHKPKPPHPSLTKFFSDYYTSPINDIIEIHKRFIISKICEYLQYLMYYVSTGNKYL